MLHHPKRIMLLYFKRCVSASVILLFVKSNLAFSQELFPHSEPASNIAKGVLGIRIANEGFNEITQFRSQQNFRFMFGITSKLMITESFLFSNHHGYYFPSDFIKQDADNGYYTNGVARGRENLYQFESMNLNIKYRFLSRDGEKQHFRMSGYLELAGGNEAHYEAEPNLTGDNGGIGAGITATQLKNKFAVSLTVGGIIPHKYHYQLKDSTLDVKYGNAITAILSFGRLCLPAHYKSYNQTNINIYAEFVGKIYGGASVVDKGNNVAIINFPALGAGSYVEFRPSVQFIFHSNLRVDLSVGEPIINQSYAHIAPMYYFTIQRYFYFK